MSHFRTLTVVVKVEDGSDLSRCGHAVEVAREALRASGFAIEWIRNAPNPEGALPPLPSDVVL